MDCVKYVGVALSELKPSTLNACWRPIWPGCVKTNHVSPNTTELHSDIITVAHAIGREGFEELTIENVAELTADKVLNEEEILEIVLEEHVHSKESSDDEEGGPITANSILEGLQLANKLGNHFLTNDHNVERAVQFQRDLTACMAHYQESYKELTKTKSQQSITEFMFKTSEPVNLVRNTSPLNISSDESDFVPNMRKRVRLLPDSDSE